MYCIRGLCLVPPQGAESPHIVPYIQGGITIGWSREVKRGILTRQRHCCPICGMTLRKPYCFHHIENRCCRGESSVANGEARHVACEAWAHQADNRGNPTIAQINEYRRTLGGTVEPEVSDRHAFGDG